MKPRIEIDLARVAELEGRTVADVVEAANARKVALEVCNDQLRRIRALGEAGQ